MSRFRLSKTFSSAAAVSLGAAGALGASALPASAAWEPVRPVELVRTAGEPGWHIEDGNHRLRAAMDSGTTEVRARVIERDESGRIVRDELMVLTL